MSLHTNNQQYFIVSIMMNATLSVTIRPALTFY